VIHEGPSRRRRNGWGPRADKSFASRKTNDLINLWEDTVETICQPTFEISGKVEKKLLKGGRRKIRFG